MTKLYGTYRDLAIRIGLNPNAGPREIGQKLQALHREACMVSEGLPKDASWEDLLHKRMSIETRPALEVHKEHAARALPLAAALGIEGRPTWANIGSFLIDLRTNLTALEYGIPPTHNWIDIVAEQTRRSRHPAAVNNMPTFKPGIG